MGGWRILADENVPFAREAFAQFGEVRLAPGREIRREDLVGVDALVVRSVTKVDDRLLDGSALKFVGTATIGTEHLDLAELDAREIAWSSAKGSNARSAAEYVVAVILEHATEFMLPLHGRTLGVIGHGSIGSLSARLGRVLGLEVLVCDPPLYRAGELPQHLTLEELLPRCDIVTLHVPLHDVGEHGTEKLLDAGKLALLKTGALLINTSRGPVVEQAEAELLAVDGRIRICSDVFLNEQTPSRSYVRNCWLATPHIAGYSFEGKANGTRMMAQAMAALLGVENRWELSTAPPAGAEVELSDGPGALLQAVRASYQVRADDERLRAGLHFSDSTWAKHFDGLRRSYPVRREFANYIVRTVDPGAGEVLAGLGFRVR